MRTKFAIIITNYNMPERADALAAHIKTHSDPLSYDLFLVDNGSDLMPPALHTTVFLPKNLQTTGGFLEGLRAAKRTGEDYLAYWFLITSAELVDGSCYLEAPLLWFHADPELVGIHPSLTPDSTTAWGHLKSERYKYTWMLDTIAVFWRAEWFDSIGWFDERLIYAWGIDLETSYLARRAHKRMMVAPWPRVRKITDIGYKMNRMCMTAEDRCRLARQNMVEVLSQKYGKDWEYLMREVGRGERFVTDNDSVPLLLR